jgi:hypothetical protein
MGRRIITLAIVALAISAFTAPAAAARDFGAVYADDMVYRVFGNRANVPDGTGTDPFATFTNSSNSAQLGVAEFAPGSATDHHGGRWAVYRATWVAGDSSELITSWSELQAHVESGDISLVRDAAADFRCPVLGNPRPIG